MKGPVIQTAIGPASGRGGLKERPFAYRATRDGRVFISWFGQRVVVLKAAKAESFLARIMFCNDEEEQLVMAKLTGNFKRGNEGAAGRD